MAGHIRCLCRHGAGAVRRNACRMGPGRLGRVRSAARPACAVSPSLVPGEQPHRDQGRAVHSGLVRRDLTLDADARVQRYPRRRGRAAPRVDQGRRRSCEAALPDPGGPSAVLRLADAEVAVQMVLVCAIALIAAPVVQTPTVGLGTTLDRAWPFSLARCHVPASPGCLDRLLPSATGHPSQYSRTECL